MHLTPDNRKQRKSRLSQFFQQPVYSLGTSWKGWFKKKGKSFVFKEEGRGKNGEGKLKKAKKSDD